MKNLLFILLFLLCNVPYIHAQTISMDGTASRTYIHHSEIMPSIHIDNLIPNDTYTIIVNSNNVATDDLIDGISNTFNLVQNPGENDYTFTATESFIDISINSALALQCFDGLWVSVSFEAQSMSSPTALVNVVQTTITDQTIKDVFIGGDCFDVTGSSTFGNPASFAYFTGGMTSLGFDEGIVLSTGNINSIPGPNNATGTSDNMGTTTTDPDLDLILQQINSGSFIQRDLAIIEFDFQPTIDTLTFEFVFASEEYCDYVDSQFNDVFGFFISGPGLAGGFTNAGVNLAIVPGSGEAITINTINHNFNSAFYEDNQQNVDNDPDCAGNDFTTPIAPLDNMFDGLTTAMTATAVMIPCETYHIKMAIADVGDGAWDAAVFLKAASFKAGLALVKPDVISDIGLDNIFLEGCEGGDLIFSLAGEPLDTNLTITFTIDPASTATPGVDYDIFPTTVTIPAGQTSVSIPINVIGDLLVEGQETIIINIDQSCSCNSLELEIIIEDVPPLEVTGEDFEICEGESVTLTPGINGGVPNYTYIWSTNETTPSITPVLDLGTNEYFVTVTDACDQEDTTMFTVIVNEVPTAELLGTSECLMDSVILEVQFTGSPTWDITYTFNNAPVTVTGITTNPYFFTVTTPGIYILTSVTSNGCPGTVTGMVEVLDSPPMMINGEDFEICEGESVTLTPNIIGGLPPYTYVWSNFLMSASITPNDLVIGSNTYSVTVTDQCDQVDTTSFNVIVNELPSGELLGSSLCLFDSVTLEIELFGPSPWDITYTVDGNPITVTDITTSPYLFTVTTPGTYVLTDVISFDCPGQVQGSVEVLFTPPMSISGQTYGLCEGETVTLTPTIDGGLAPYTYNWSTFETTPTITPNNLMFGSNTYSVTVTDMCDQLDTTSFTIEYTVEPGAVLVSNPTLCLTDSVVLEVQFTGNAPWDLTYTFNNNPITITGINATPHFITVTDPGTYIMSSVLSYGCTGDAVGNVTVLFSPEIDITGQTYSLCEGETVTLTPTIDGGLPPYSYQWSNFLTSSTITPNDLQFGPNTYSVTVTDMCDKVDTTSFYINYTEEPQAVLVASGLICLYDSVSLEILLTGEAPWDLNYTVDNVPVTIAGITASPYYLTITTPGTYELTSVISNDCPGDAFGSVDVLIAPPLVLTSQDYSLCEGENILLDPQLEGGLPPYTYTWSNFLSSTTITPNDLEFGNNLYTVTVMDGCNQIDSASFNVLYTELPTASLDGDDVICLTDTATLVIILTGNGPWDLGYTFNSTPITITGITDSIYNLNVTQPGLYELTTISANGCDGVAMGNSTIIQSEIIVDITYTEPLCHGDSTGTANVNLQNANPPINFEWSNGIMTTDNAIGDLPAGDYSVTITDVTNCPIVRTVSIDEPTPLIITSVTVDTINCANPEGSIFLEAEGGTGNLSYLWTPGNANTQNLIDVADGTYNVLVSDINNCSIETDTFIPNQISYPDVSIVPADIINCLDTTIELDGNWTSTTANTTTEWIHESVVYVSDPNDIIEINEGGIYIFTVTNNDNFCSTSDTVDVLLDQTIPNLNLENVPDITCLNPLDTIGDPNWALDNPNYDFEWSSSNTINPTSSTSAITTDTSGSFQLITTNTVNHCVDTSNIDIGFNQDYPIIEAGPPDTFLCSTEFIQLNGTVLNPANDSYQWTTTDGNINGPSDILNPQATLGGTYVLTVTNEDSGCETSDNVVLISNSIAPTVLLQVSGIITCDDPSVTLSSNGSSNQGAFGYNWYTFEGNFVDLTDINNPIVDEEGFYYLEITNTFNGCSRFDSIYVDSDLIDPLLNTPLPDTITCIQTQVPISVTVTAATNNIDFQWSTTEGNFVSGTDNSLATVNSTGFYYVLVENNVNGCTVLDTVFVAEDNDDPFLDVADPDSLNCGLLETALGTIITLDNEFSVLWTTTNGTIVDGATTLTPTISQGGTYTVNLTNTHNGCTNSRTVEVIELPDIANVFLSADDPTCLENDGSITIESVEGGSDPYIFSIDGGQSFYTDPSFLNLPYGQFNILVQDNYDCVYNLSYELDAPEEPNVYLPELVELVFGDNYMVNTFVDIPESEIDSILWTPSEGVSDVNILRPILNPVENTVYTLTIYNKFYCPATATIDVRVKFDKDIYIPTGFSPNSDGVNDMFFIQSSSNSIELIKSLQIYDRWGTKLFHIDDFLPNDPQFGWDGRFNEEYLNPGVFMYWTKVQFVDGTVRIYEGDVTLLR